MPLPTKVASIDVLTEALTLHGWNFTKDAATVRVPDEDTDYASRYSSRRRMGRKDVPGFAVSFDNGVPAAGRHYDGDSVRGVLYFTEKGSYIAEMTRQDYPIAKGMPLKDVLALVAKRSKAEIDRKRDLRAEQEEQRLAEAIQKADAEVEAAHAAYLPARHAAILSLAYLTSSTDSTEVSVGRLLDALAKDEALIAYRNAEWALEQANSKAASARAYYQSSEARGFL